MKNKMQELKTEILENVENSLDKALERLLDGLTTPIASPPRPRKGSGAFREKVFVCRESALTELWAVSHMRSAFNICTALFIVLITNLILLYIAEPKQFWNDLEFVTYCFGNVTVWGGIVALMHVSLGCVLYPGYKYWAFKRFPSPEIRRFDVIFLILYILFQVYLFIAPVYLLLVNNLSPLQNCIIVSEQTRLLMKSYAFVRENLSRAINFKVHQEENKDLPKEPCPEFQKFLYFLFAPTLVYRDSYPRTPKVHWDKVAWLFVQFLACILTTFTAFQRCVVQIFNSVGNEQFRLETLVIVLSGCILVGCVFMFCGFYGFLHCWMNAFAEMLRFGDRTFYSDWWNSTSYQKYYRTWNTIVHDWLYAYIYRDLIKVFPGSRAFSMFLVFLISAIMHEYIIAMILGFLYPIMFGLMITFGVWVVHLTRGRTSDLWNVFIWWGVCCGWGVMFVLYSSEYYSRRNCPSSHTGLMDFIVPRSWSCQWLQIPFLQGNSVAPSSVQ